MTSSLKVTKNIAEYHFLYPKLQVQILSNLAIAHFSALHKILNLQSPDCELDISLVGMVIYATPIGCAGTVDGGLGYRGDGVIRYPAI